MFQVYPKKNNCLNYKKNSQEVKCQNICKIFVSEKRSEYMLVGSYSMKKNGPPMAGIEYPGWSLKIAHA